jgi:glycosyltransferase involved in cell wall biosynthesis
LWLRTIKALRDIQELELSPVIFGSGPLATEVAEEAKALGLDDLEVHSGITDPSEIYGRLDVLLLMSRVEGLPNVLLEAQAMGKPVAACDVGGVMEAVKLNGKGAGLVLPADVTPEAAAEDIKKWLPTALSAPPYLIRRHIEGQFAPSLLASRTLCAYRGERTEIS